MKKWIWFCLCFLLLAQLSCSRSSKQVVYDGMSKDSGEGKYSAGMVAQETSEPAGLSLPNQTIPNMTNRKIIQNGSVSMEAEDPIKASDAIQQYAISKKGYLANAEKNNYQDVISIYMQIKIPVQEWNGFIAFLQKQGKVTKETVSTNEITREYYDVKARLTNAENQLKQYTLVLSKAQKIDDILKTQQQIDMIQERIEQLKGQIQLWDQQVALSTIDIYLKQTSNIQATSKNPTWDFLSGSEMWKLIKNNAITVFSGIIKFIQYLIVIVLIYLLPIGLIIWFIYWCIRYLVKTWQKKGKKKS